VRSEEHSRGRCEMKKLNFLVSLTTNENDYQIEQEAAAVEAGQRLGVGVQVVYADNDPIKQSKQLLEVIQSPKEKHPNAIVFEPVGGTALPQVARAATAAGIGWVILNREADYLKELRQNGKAPVFSISSDHLEIGRIQALQMAALLPRGGTVLYIQGPSDNSAAKQRTQGMQQMRPENIKVILLKGQWTEDSAYRAVGSWMRLSTSRKTPIDLVSAQDDAMALGARKAFQGETDAMVREKWLSLPFIGCDGLPKTGQEFVRRGLLAATVYVPPNTTLALEMLVGAIQKGTSPAELALTVPASFPRIDELSSKHSERNRALVTR
jgi:ribose transport system substrate-binding protein